MSTKSTKPTGKLRAVAITAIGLAVLAGAITWVVMAWRGSPLDWTSNYAEEVAKPLEEALVEAGGVKKCSTGDPGRGPDNTRPWYNAVFETSRAKGEAAEMITKIAEDSGHRLKHETSPYDYIDWYVDTSKQSAYSDLESGSIQLSMNVYSGGDNLDCPGDASVNYGPHNAAVVLNVTLPNVKR